MYYVEQTIDGVIQYKNSPKGKWIKFSDVQLTTRIEELEARLLAEFNKGLNHE